MNIGINENVYIEKKDDLYHVMVWCGVDDNKGNWVSYNSFKTQEEAVIWALIETNVK